MAYNMYFGSKPVSDWTANGSKESGHNFIDQIDEQAGKIAGHEDKYNNQYGKLDNLQSAYDEAYKGQQNYSDLYGQAKTAEGVDDAKAQYQKSLASVNATNSAMNNLPSSINAGSNVVLNSSQRNAALGNQMTKFQNTLDYQTRQNAGDRDMYQTALSSAQDLAGKNMSQEQTKVNQAMANLQTNMDMANNLYNQLLQERNIMRTIYGQMYDDEYRHMQNELEAWANNLQAETQRYAEDQATARNNAKIAADKYAADAGLRLQQYLAEQQKDADKSVAKANDLDRINQIYSQYQGELNDLRNNTFWNYANPLLGLWGDSASMKAMRAKELENKGFEDYLYNKDPYAQKILRENYSDLLGMYGIGG